MRRIDPEAWRRVAPELDRALDLPPGERERFVRRAFPDAPELRSLLRELIEAEQRSEDLLETPAAEWLHPGSMPDPVPDMTGPKPEIDGYEIGEELGRGGMGVVYAAVRRGDGFEQRVALKVVLPEVGGALLHARFERERSILARLEHPNIARLVDGGSTDDGRSYFAMEFVDGVPITEYADARRLSVRDRVDLFLQVCAAVSFAHQQLVIHRDLKPSNILVDTGGRVRLLDFGIARIIEPDQRSAASGLTRDGSRLLTPEYAAPEQIHGHLPSTATDVYSLGVLLFELLSGSHPGGDAPAATLEFALGTREMRWLPSSATPEAAAARSTRLRTLRRQLRGDLTAICTKALQRDPHRRYASAESLAEDLQRYRGGQPVHARVPTWGYRARKSILRHRASWTAAVLVLASLAAGFVVSIREAAVAEEQSRRATRAYQFLAGLFEQAHPDAAQGKDYTATELLVEGADRLTREWADDPRGRADLQDLIGTVLTDRGDYDAADRVLRRALVTAPPSDRNRLRLALARLELFRQRLDVADSLRAVISESKEGLDDDTWSTLYEIAASIHFQRGEYATAESLMQRVIRFTSEKFGPSSPEYAKDLNTLSNYRSAEGRFDQAESMLTRAAEILDETQPGPTMDKALIQHNLGDLYRITSQYDQAIRAYESAIDIRHRLYPNGHPRLADSIWGLALAYRGRGHLDITDSLLAESLSMRERVGDSRGESYARQWNEAAIQAYLRSDLETARERFARAYELFREELGPGHPTTLTVANNLATVQSMSGHYQEALESFREIRSQRVASLGEDHPDVAFSDNSIGQVLRRLGRPQESIALHRRALKTYLRLHGENHVRVSQTRRYLGRSLLDAGRPEEAIPLLRKALDYDLANFPPGQQDRVDTRITLGLALVEAKQWAEADTLLARTLEEIDAAQAIPPGWRAQAQAAWGFARVHHGGRESGRSAIRSGLDALREAFGADDPRTRLARSYLERLEGE